MEYLNWSFKKISVSDKILKNNFLALLYAAHPKFKHAKVLCVLKWG
jgi:hypothetical protein